MSNEGLMSKIRGLFGSSQTSEVKRQFVEDDDSEERHDLHYYFAHRFLPQLAARDALELVNDLCHELSSELLAKLWLLGASGHESKRRTKIPSNGLKSIPVRINTDYYGVVVQLPKPKRMAEAYFVAIVINDNDDEHLFFTLEYGLNINGSKRTVLGQWENETHHNFGDGPAPQIDLFVKSLRKLLEPHFEQLDDLQNH